MEGGDEDVEGAEEGYVDAVAEEHRAAAMTVWMTVTFPFDIHHFSSLEELVSFLKVGRFFFDFME